MRQIAGGTENHPKSLDGRGDDGHLIGHMDSPESDQHLQFEIGHVLFIDVVGYSALLMEEQKERLGQLTDIVLATPQVKESPDEQLVKLPTGDGMALVFRHSSEEPARCALQVAEALKKYPEIPVRMGIHSGPVSDVTDVSGRANIAGAGINMAQRVMDCGDAGHILLSQRVADDLAQYRQWAPRLHDLGECEVKHGVRLHLVNLYAEQIGNPAVPAKFQRETRPPLPTATGDGAKKSKLLPLAIVILCILLVCLLIVGLIFAPALLKSSSRQAVRPIPPVPPPPPSAPASSIPEKSIAVLPFENLSADKNNAYFADGVQDEILTNLAKIADLKVISRTSVTQFKDAASRNLRQIGQALGVANVLEGSVQKAGDRVRVNAQLIDARTDAHLWAQTFDRDLADVFAIQTDIAKTIADQLQAKLSPKEQAQMEAKPTKDMVAYDLYLRAIEIGRDAVTAGGGTQDIKQAAPFLEEAVRRDPAFVPALCELARNHLYLYWQGDRSEAHVERARKLIEQAAQQQPDAAEVHSARGILHYWGQRDYESALRELALAKKESPNDPVPAYFIAMVERRQGKFEETRRHLAEVMAADPRNLGFVSEAAGTEFQMRRYAEAVRMVDEASTWKPNDFDLELERAGFILEWKADLQPWQALVTSAAAKNANPNQLAMARFWLALLQRDYHGAGEVLAGGQVPEFDILGFGFFIPREWQEAMVARGLGDEAKAKEKFLAARERAAAAVQSQPENGHASAVLGQIDASLGRKEEAIREGKHAAELLPVAKDSIGGPDILIRLAGIYAEVGEADRAFGLLDKLSKMPAGVNYGSLKLDPVWDPLRKDSRFDKLLATLAPGDAT